jgi:phage anti-repressor protein
MQIGDKQLQEPKTLDEAREVYNILGLKFSENSPEWLNEYYNAKQLVKMNNYVRELNKQSNIAIHDLYKILKEATK